MNQATALEILKTGANVFLTGEPGSGKTYLINRYIRYLRDHDIRVAVTASTGIAATHIDGRTIHSWSGIGIKKMLTPPEFDRLQHNTRLVQRLQATNVLIIDEVSMLDAQTLDLVDSVCRVVRKSPVAFGGLQVILVGDFFQLPPVQRDGEESGGFAFEAECWKEALFEICYLTEQHRHGDRALTQVLAEIRGGNVSAEAIGHLRSRLVAHHDEHAAPTKLYAHNTNVDHVNTEKLKQLDGDSRVFTMRSDGPKPLVEALRNGCLSPEQLELKIGTAVMCTKNNPEAGFVNGTLATVTGFEQDTGYPVIETASGRRMTVEPMDWTVEEGGRIAATITQIPLRLAWAITIHKSQGMSLDAAVMDLSRSFAFGQGYVALSRIRTLAGLHILGWNDRALLVDPAIREQDASLREASANTERDWAAVPEELQRKRQHEFIRACGGRVKPAANTGGHGRVQKPSPYGSYGDRLISIREKYPEAYKPWTEEADELVRSMYDGQTSIKKIADRLKRQPSAIRSRVKHLGLSG